MNVNKKDLVLLPYPFTNLRESKVRPAIVVSNDSFNNKSLDCILVPITSVIKDEEYSVKIEQSDLLSGKLIKSSRVKANKLFAVDKRLIIMKIGTLNTILFSRIKSEILKIF